MQMWVLTRSWWASGFKHSNAGQTCLAWVTWDLCIRPGETRPVGTAIRLDQLLNLVEFFLIKKNCEIYKIKRV